MTAAFHVADGLLDFLPAARLKIVGIYGETVVTDELKHAPLIGIGRVFYRADIVEKGGQTTIAGDLGIQVAQCSRRRIASVFERLIDRAIQVSENRQAHHRFTVDLHEPFVRNAERNIAYGAHLLKHILPRFAVTARGGIRQDTPPIRQIYGKPVQLVFQAKCQRLICDFSCRCLGAVKPLAKRLFRLHLIHTPKPRNMLMLTKGIERFAPHASCG